MIDDSGEWNLFADSLFLEDDGIYNVKFKAIDFVGNESSIEEVDFEIITMDPELDSSLIRISTMLTTWTKGTVEIVFGTVEGKNYTCFPLIE